MITFLTLLLGLVAGAVPVEVVTSGPVAAVELVLDGVPAARIGSPPWRAKVDFGRDLQPHELVARALDEDGEEVGRAALWVNLPRPPADVSLLLENGPHGRPARARVAWDAPDRKLLGLGVTFDGLPLPVDGGGRAALPPYDPDEIHILRAEVRFDQGVSARKDRVFGGTYGEELDTELTAVPVRLRGSKELPGAGRLQGWLTVRGEPAPVAAVEKGPARVILVRVPTLTETFRHLAPGQRFYTPRTEMRLPEGDVVRLIGTQTRPASGGRLPTELFEVSRDLTREDGGIVHFLTQIAHGRSPGRPLQVADAVAVAGVQALGENRRRAVVLVLGEEDKEDASRYDAATVVRWLHSIRVPLVVWTVVPPKRTPLAQAWADAGAAVEDASNTLKLARAFRRLEAELESQRILWIEGRHLPQAVGLTPAARGVELVSVAPGE
jgi:hypothetical protein